MAQKNKELQEAIDKELALRNALQLTKEQKQDDARRRPDESPTALDTVGPTALEIKAAFDELEGAVKGAAGVGALFAIPKLFKVARAHPYIAGGIATATLIYLAGKRLPSESTTDYEIRLRSALESDEYESLSSRFAREERIGAKYQEKETN